MAMSVLVVDDDADKLVHIQQAIQPALSEDAEVFTADSVVSAKLVLRERAIDLLILDIALPLRRGDAASNWAGVDLLDEVKTRSIYKIPQHIIGLTSYQDVYRKAADEFSSELWSIVLYDRSGELWIDQLQAKIRHIHRVKEEHQQDANSVDLCVVAALGDPELDAILRLDWSWTVEKEDSDATVYHRGVYEKADGSKGSVLAARASSMGMPSAAVLAMKMSLRYRPRVLIMPGICAGDSKETALGDLVVGNPTWDYGSGKHTVKDNVHIFEPAIYQLPLAARLRGLLERVSSDANLLSDISKSYNGERPTTSLRVHIGPLASGSAVLADSSAYKAVQVQHRKLIGIDMEAYAVMLAGYESPAPAPEVLVLKGVSDFADEKKGDKFRYYAAHVSARVLGVLAERFNL